MNFLEKIGTILKKYFKVYLIVSDILSVVVAFFLATYLKFDADNFFKQWFIEYRFMILIVDIVGVTVFFVIFKIYRRMWQYMIPHDYGALGVGFMLSKIVTCSTFFIIMPNLRRNFFTFIIIFSLIELMLILISRGLVVVGYKIWKNNYLALKEAYEGKRKRVMIIGAGDAAVGLINSLRGVEQTRRVEVVALIDDNKRKQGEFLCGVRVYGGRNDIPRYVNELDIDEIYFAAPSASEYNKKAILDICSKTGCVLKTLPGVAEVNKNKNIGQSLRNVEYHDLLGREQIKPDLSKAFELLKNKTVLITGGGGSIGSELVRQIAGSGAAKTIIIFDIAENGAYDIQQEIRRNYPEVDLKVLIGSVRDEKRLCEVFEEYHPDFVYHAAAHKHVPLMEDSPKEAVKNNAFGTYNLARTADKYGVKRFVMISTDKAVNPTNVMGATKRICEMIVQSFNKISKTDFVAVRFGNVLGSNGSVIPLFKEQIAKGGPVTVTHPDIIRYFMLIPEAVSLVLQAGANAKGGEIFILDMGSPVKIRELAENLIRLSGYVPYEDIEIKYTGLRDGEKLYEELLISEEGIQKTENDLIYIAKPIEFDSDVLFKKLKVLRNNIDTMSRTDIIESIADIVPTYTKNNKEYNEIKAKEHQTV